MITCEVCGAALYSSPFPSYSFTCANGICENNCRSTIMFSRRSNWKNVAAFLPGNTWLTTGTYFKRSACASPSASASAAHKSSRPARSSFPTSPRTA